MKKFDLIYEAIMGRVPDQRGAETVYRSGDVSVFKVLDAKWINKNFSDCNWPEDDTRFFNDKTKRDRNVVYVVVDASKQPSVYDGYGLRVSGDDFHSMLVMVKDGAMVTSARNEARMHKVGQVEVYNHLAGLGVKPEILGLAPMDVDAEHRSIFKQVLAKAEKEGKLVDEDGIRILTGDLTLSQLPIVSLKGLDVDVVVGDFECSCSGLSTLEGGPTKVKSFTVRGAQNLKDLKHCPIVVDGDFSCSHNKSLTSLEGCPVRIKGKFSCNACQMLQSLEHCPVEGVVSFDCSETGVTSLEHCPTSLAGSFSCTSCHKLKSLDHCPSKVNFFSCADCDARFTRQDVEQRCEAKAINV